MPSKTKCHRNRSRIFGLVGLVVLVSGCGAMYGRSEAGSPSRWPWEAVSPESQGIASEDLARVVDRVETANLDVDSIIVYRNGTVPFEVYFDPYDADVSHNMKSTSKAVISTLAGIALREGFIESLDDSILSYLPEYETQDPRKGEITVRDLLTMSSGLGWKENGLHSIFTFFVSRRIVPGVLDQPLVAEPGSHFNYSTGSTHLLSAVLANASGMSTLDFAREYLFEPLDIRNVQWDQDRDGYHIGGSELYLTPRAMTKLGVLYLNRGRWAGRQILPETWVEEATATQIEGSFHGAPIRYGYLWWLDIGNPLFTYLDEESAYVAMGVRGQRILVLPDRDTVVVVTADQTDESRCDELIRDYILPALKAGET